MTKEIMNALENVNTLVEMDNAMESLGFQSVFDEVSEDELKNNGSASYLVPDSDDSYINVVFEADGEGIKVIDVEEI